MNRSEFRSAYPFSRKHILYSWHQPHFRQEQYQTDSLPGSVQNMPRLTLENFFSEV